MKATRAFDGSRWMTSMCLLFAASSAFAQTPSRLPAAVADDLKRGFVAAQQCEKELDDDLSAYRSCIDYLTDRRERVAREKLGIHFQAWIVADLMARQHSDFAATMRSEQQKRISALLRTTRLTLAQLCEAKDVACADIGSRMRAAQ
jgi:hypothetical protein